MKIQINGSAVLGHSSTNRPGTVVLSATSPFSPSQPYEGIQLTAAMTNPDSEPVKELTWQWYKLVSGTETETDWRKINGAIKQSYTPTIHEEGYFLRATASYKQTFTDTTLDQTAHGMTTGYVKGDISEPPGVDFENNSALGRLRVGKWVTGAISNETGRPGDPFTVDLVQGRRYRIDLEGTATGRGSMPDPLLSNVYYIVGSALPQAPESYDNDSGKGGVNAQITFTAEVTATYYILANGNNSQGTYRLTVQEIVDDLGLWYTDWGAEKLGGFLRPSQEATGNLYGPHIIERSGGQRDKDGFLFYLGSDEAPMNSDYILTIRGQNAPRLQVQTFYDLSNLDDYIENFSLDPKFIEFPGTEYGNPDPDLSDAEAGRIRPVVPRPVGTVLGTSQEGEYHLVFNPGREDIGAYLATIKSHRKYDTGRYGLVLRRYASMSEPEGEDFGALDWNTKGYVRVGESVTGNIDDGGSDNDVLATLLQEGRTYLIEVKGSETCHGTMPDPSIMELVAAKPGSLEASFAGATEVACPNISDCGDDDGGQGLNSRIVYSPRETNLFYINVSDLKVNFTPEPFSPSREGTYTLSVTDITDIPRIVTDGVRVTSTPASGDAYREGENIEITVTFSKAVVVSGSPQFEFCMGSGECVDGDDPPARRRASLISGNGTTELVFTYTVQTGDSDGDGIWIGDHTRTLKLDAEDTIQDVSSRKDAILNHDAPGTQSGHKVDTS